MNDSDTEFSISSESAYVACARTSCWNCHAGIEVVCIYCESGMEAGEPLSQFVVSDIRAMDAPLVKQLGAWPGFKEGSGPTGATGEFANHCGQCGASQDEAALHTEPDDPFFGVSRAEPGAVRLVPLVGKIRLDGDCHFEV